MLTISIDDRLNLYRKIVNIPFLDLGPVPNFDRMQAEAIQVYQNNELMSMHMPHPTDDCYLNLMVQGIFDYKGITEISSQSNSSLQGYKVANKMPVAFEFGELTRATKFSKQTPAMVDYLSSILDNPGRSRLSVLKPGQSVGWHNHYHGDFDSEVALHVPLVTNPLVTAQVGQTDFAVLDSPLATQEQWFAEPAKKFSCHFTAGHLWLLNIKHTHRFVNNSPQARIHLWISTSLSDHNGLPINNALFSKIKSAVDSYSGPIIDPDWAWPIH